MWWFAAFVYTIGQLSFSMKVVKMKLKKNAILNFLEPRFMSSDPTHRPKLKDNNFNLTYKEKQQIFLLNKQENVSQSLKNINN